MPISSKSPSVRTNGVTWANLSNFCIFRDPVDFFFICFLTTKVVSNSVPPPSSVPYCYNVCCVSDSSTLMVACNIVVSWFARSLSTASFPLAVASFCSTIFSQAEAFYAYLFFHDVVVYVVVSFIALLAHVEKN